MTETYNPSDFRLMARHEDGHYWFESRRELVLDALSRHCREASSYLEIGAGTGFVLDEVGRRFPEWRAFGTDLFEEALAVARSKRCSAPLFVMDAEHTAVGESFDVVVALDVIEHLDDDRLVLRNLAELTNPGGAVVITVPQHPWLWSVVDEYGHHRRRYRRAELMACVEQARLVVEQVTSFVSFLLPLMLLSRRLLPKDVAAYSPESELRIDTRLNAVLSVVLSLERRLIARGWSLPAGGSLLIVARKPEAEPASAVTPSLQETGNRIS